MISVCLATYNGELFLKEQLTSILKQLGDSDEVVVSDDGSTDLTLTILQEFNDPRIKVFHHDKRKQKYSFDYATHNFENAIRKIYRFFTSFQHFGTKKWSIYIVCQKKCVSLRAISRKRELK